MAHRKEYEAAKIDFATFIQAVIDKHSKSDPTIRSIVAKDCMFRINRDVRFSKDKSPYKTNMGAYINAEEKNLCLQDTISIVSPDNVLLAGDYGCRCLLN
jgi:uncharacterized protein (TIGR02453 family)